MALYLCLTCVAWCVGDGQVSWCGGVGGWLVTFAGLVVVWRAWVCGVGA